MDDLDFLWWDDKLNELTKKLRDEVSGPLDGERMTLEEFFAVNSKHLRPADLFGLVDPESPVCSDVQDVLVKVVRRK